MNYHICNKLCGFVVFLMFVFCRKASAQIVDIGELMGRKDLTLQQIETIAANHFNIAGKGKGSGYKVFERWRYEQKFHLDENGYIRPPEQESLAYEYAKRTLERSDNNERAVANWTEMGPKSWTASSGWTPGVGRLTSVAIHPSNTAVIYVGSPGGGIWKSTNSGAAWTPLIDNVNTAWMNIYSLCITPSDQNVVYAGITDGGVIKSSNAGATWEATGAGPYDIRKILVHPTDASIVLVAASNGVWRSTNAGNSWTLVDTTISAVDIEFKANDPNIVLASFSSNIVLRSTDNGVNWVSISLVASGRTMLGVSPDNPNIIYAVQASGALFGRFYKSTNAGLTFTSLITGNPANGTNFFGDEANGTSTTGQAWYDMAICVNPSNVNEVHIAGIICWKSTNGGTSFTAETEWLYPNSTGYNHADVHSLEYINSTIYSATDGGIYKSLNKGGDWTDLSSGLGIRQFYRIACAKTNHNIMTGGAQDNGSSYHQANGNWMAWLGGDGMDGVISPTNPNIAIGTSQNGAIYKTTNGGTSYINLNKPSNGNWVTPLAMHPTDHDTIYGGWTGIYRSNNGGLDWNLISGTTITDKLECLAVAPSNTRYIYGTVDSTLYRTSNAGATWTSVTASGTITSICISPTNPQKIWITTSNSNNNVLVSTNAGSSWTNIATGLPAVAARSVVVDNTPYEGVYVGMNIGVYYRNNANTAWAIHANGLPLVEINEVELQLSSKKVRVATYGRGVWESNMQPTPTVSAGADVTVTCTNPSATLTATNGVSYLWNTGATTASINVSPTVTTTYVVTATMSAGNKTSDAVIITVNTQNCNLVIQPKVFLNHVSPSTLLMDNYVSTLADFPLSDPYATVPLNTNFTHVNNAPIATITPSILAQRGNNAIIDWIFLELRTGLSGSSSVVYTKAALLQSDGDIVATDGISPVEFIAPSGNYYIAVRHRNNLGFRTTNTFPLSGIPTVLNFSNSSIPLYGSNPLSQLLPTLAVMNGGDANFDGSIDAFDTIILGLQNGTVDNYVSNADYNLDGSVDALDSILWEIKNGRFQELE